MNRIIVWLMIGATGAGLVCQRLVLMDARARERLLEDRAEAALLFARQSRADLTLIENALNEELVRMRDVHKAVAQFDSSEQTPAEFPSSIQPGQCWPSEEPWCYLPKRDLLRYAFPTFSPEGLLSEQASLVFGFSAAQRARVEAAYETFLTGIRTAELPYLKPANVSPGNEDDFSAQTYEINVPVDQMTAYYEQFKTFLRDLLAHSQAELFTKSIETSLRAAFYELSHSPIRLTTYTRSSKKSSDEEFIILNYDFKPAEVGSLGKSKYLYPQDEDTALAFRYYQSLLQSYLASKTGSQLE